MQSGPGKSRNALALLVILLGNLVGAIFGSGAHFLATDLTVWLSLCYGAVTGVALYLLMRSLGPFESNARRNSTLMNFVPLVVGFLGVVAAYGSLAPTLTTALGCYRRL